MKRIHVVISDEAHTLLLRYQKKHNYSNLDTAIEAVIRQKAV